MKKYLVLLIVLILSLGAVSFADDISKDIELFHDIQGLGYEKVYVDIDSELTLIKLEDISALDRIHTIFKLSYNRAQSERISIVFYDQGKAIYEFSTTKKAAGDYATKAINVEAFSNLIEAKDLRSIEDRIELDVSVFDTMVYKVDLDNNSCSIDLFYNGTDEEEFVADIPNMILKVVEHAPWVENTTLRFQNHENSEQLIFTVNTVVLFDLMEGTIDLEKFYEYSNISVEGAKGFLQNAGKFVDDGINIITDAIKFIPNLIDLIKDLHGDFGNVVYILVAFIGIILLWIIVTFFRILGGIFGR